MSRWGEAAGDSVDSGTTSGGTMAATRYIAFISYRRGGLDERVATYLQRRIERYWLPRGVVSRDGSRRPGRVFIDREELSASHSLAETLTAALTHSQFLIVVCSESTAASPWVAREVDFFMSLGRRERVLVVLAGRPDGPAPSALIAALHPDLTEPLAVDMRAASVWTLRSPARREMPRLIAPLVGCSLDDLLRREQARQRRRLAAVATTSTAASCAFALLAAYAFNQKSLADRRLLSALSSAEYISQVIDRGLEPIPGTAEHRRDLLATSQDLLQQLGSEAAGNARLVYDQFNDHLQRGDLAASHGNPPEAQKEYEQAGRLIEMLGRTSTESYILYGRAVVRERFGRTAFALGDYAAALGHYRSVLALVEPAADQSWQLAASLITTYQDLADCLKATSDLEGASAYLALAQKRLSELGEPKDSRDRQEYLRLQYVTLERDADIRAQTGQLIDALKANGASLDIKNTLRLIDPNNRHYLRDLGNGYELKGDYFAALKQPREALDAYQQSLKLRRELLTMDPASIEVATNVSISLLELAGAHLNLDAPQQAQAFTAESLKVIEAVLQRDPDAIQPRRVLSTSLERHGDALRESGDIAGAGEAWRRSLDVRERLAKQHPTVPDFRYGVSISLERLGDWAAATGRHDRASAYYEQMLRVREELAKQAPDSLEFQDAFASGLAHAANFHDGADRHVDAATLVQRLRDVVSNMDARGLPVAEHLRSYLAESRD